MRVVVVGLGSIGERHVSNLLEIGGIEVIVVRREHRRPRIVNPDTFQTLVDLDDAIDAKPDAAILATPTSLHVGQGLRLVKAQVPTLIEVPVSDRVGEAEKELCLAAKVYRTPVEVAHNLLHHPGFMALNASIREGHIGEPLILRAEFGEYLPRVHPWEDYRQGYAARRDLGGGVSLTSMHEFKFAEILLGPFTSISSTILHNSRLHIDVEESVDALIKHRNDSVSNIHLDFLQQTYSRNLKVIGSRASIEWDWEAKSVILETPRSRTELWRQDPADLNSSYKIMLAKFLGSARYAHKTNSGLKREFRLLEFVLAAQEGRMFSEQECVTAAWPEV